MLDATSQVPCIDCIADAINPDPSAYLTCTVGYTADERKPVRIDTPHMLRAALRRDDIDPDSWVDARGHRMNMWAEVVENGTPYCFDHAALRRHG